MMRFALIALFLMLTIGSGVSAQTATPTPLPAPWPPDPEDIFAEGITWSIVDEYTVAAEEPLSIDRKRRVLRFYDAASATMREYAFPEGKEINNADIQSDGRIRVNWSDDRGYSPRYTLILDPDTGEYEDPDLVCDGKRLKDLPGEGEWDVIGETSIIYGTFLCHTETGEKQTPTTVWLTGNSMIANVDDSHLILIDYGDYQDDKIDEPEVVLYDLKSEQRVSLGQVPYWNDVDDWASVCDWLTPTIGLMCVDNAAWDWMPLNYYAFDLTQPNSLEFVFSGWSSTIFTLENPKRYFAVDSESYSGYKTGGGTGTLPCQVKVYDVTGLRTHILGGGCIPIEWGYSLSAVYRVPNFYYLATEGVGSPFYDSSTSSLHQFHAETETVSEALLIGEIEMILGVSPDERYVVVIMDNNGVLDFPWDINYSSDRLSLVTILGTQTSEIVYQIEPIAIDKADDITWIDQDTLIIRSDELWRIDLAEYSVGADRTSRYKWRNYNTCLKDENGFMVATDADRNTVLVNLATFESVALLRGYLEKDYDFTFDCYNKPLTVRISSKVDHLASVTYQVTSDPF